MPPPYRKRAKGLRWLAGAIGVAAGIGFAVELNRLAGRAEPWAGWRRAVDTKGYVILALYAGWVLAGAVLQTVPALLRRARVGKGWLVVLGLLGYGALVATLAWLIAPASPQPDYEPHSRAFLAGALYGVFLSCVLFGYAALALSGLLFPSRCGTGPARACGSEGGMLPAATQETAGDGRPRRMGVLGATTLLSWLAGSIALALLLVWWALTTEAVARFLPPSGAAFLVVGAAFGAGFGTLFVAAALTWLVGGRPTGEWLRAQGHGPVFTPLVVACFPVVGVLGDQLGRVLPAWLVSVLAGACLVAFNVVIAVVLRRRAARARRAG